LAGRKVRCKHCQTVIEVPRSGAKPADLVEDPWVTDGDDEPAEAPRAPAPARKKKKKRKKARSESSSGFRLGVISILGIVFAGLFVLMCLVGIFWRPMWGVLGGGTALIGGGLMLVGGIGIMMAAFEEDVMCGVMYLLVPFYPLYFVITRIGEVWKLLLAQVGGVVMLVLGMVLIQAMAIGGGGNAGGDAAFEVDDAEESGGLSGLFAPQPQQADSRDNLQQIGLAAHNHQDTYNRFPPAPTEKSGGQVHISWQTALLPFVDHEALFNQINQSVAWDDPANEPFNRELIDRYLQAVIDEKTDARGCGLSHYALNQALLTPQGGIRLVDMRDGMSNTIAAGEVGGGYKAWADPSNARAVAGSLTPGATTFGNPSAQGAYMLMADGSVHWIASDIDPTVLNALGTPDGGEVVDF
jgi:hypothetical protein